MFTGTPPLAFTFGLGVLVLFPMRAGASHRADREAVAGRRWSTPSSATRSRRSRPPRRCTARCSRDADLAARELAARVRLGGRAAAGGRREAWTERTGVRIIDGIGSTEMLHIFIGSPGRRGPPGLGRPTGPGLRGGGRRRGHAARRAGRGRPPRGRGPTGCRYLDDERQSVYVVDGWNLTGDAFRVDDDGYFWFAARNDDLIVSAGYNISPLEVEGALLQHHAVAECAVVASPDEERGHVVKAFVVVSDGVGAGDELVVELQQHVKDRIAPYKYPRRIEFVDALPRTLTGKVQRVVLRKREDAAAL